jgi:hypothetical protein
MVSGIKPVSNTFQLKKFCFTLISLKNVTKVSENDTNEVVFIN